eukprot:scaffold1181_cov152-Amphora_coffeaeformis.AAC.2
MTIPPTTSDTPGRTPSPLLFPRLVLVHFLIRNFHALAYCLGPSCAPSPLDSSLSALGQYL